MTVLPVPVAATTRLRWRSCRMRSTIERVEHLLLVWERRYLESRERDRDSVRLSSSRGLVEGIVEPIAVAVRVVVSNSRLFQ